MSKISIAILAAFFFLSHLCGEEEFSGNQFEYPPLMLLFLHVKRL